MATAKKITEETKAVATAQTTTLATPLTQAPRQDVVGSDRLIPRVVVAQSTSPIVLTRKAQVGDIVKSLTGEKIGGPEKPVNIIPLRMESVWINYETAKSAGTTQPAFRGMEPRHAGNANWAWEYEGPEGEEMMRKQAILLFALLPDEVKAYEDEVKRAIEAGEAPDLSKTVTPVVITFQSTSFKYGGKKIATFFSNVARAKKDFPQLAPYKYMIPLQTREEKKGSNMWYVFDFGVEKPHKNPKLEEIAVASLQGQDSWQTEDLEDEDGGVGAGAI